MKDPFALKKSSVFVIDNPFQAICAVAAIKQLEITDYLMVAVLTGNKMCNRTITRFLKSNNIIFKKRYFNSFTYKYYQWISQLHRKKGHSRLFIGYYAAPFHHSLGSTFVADGADIVYLDDGVATVTMLQSKTLNDIKYFQDKPWISRLSKRRDFEFYKNLLTIYDNITNSNYIIKPLNLSLITNRNSICIEKKNIFIIGTCSVSYTKQLNIPINKYYEEVEYLFAKLRNNYPNQKIIFVPHRLDSGKYAEALCKKYHFEYRKVKIVVELELLNQSYQPLAVIGFTSSALYNIKKMFPEIRVINYLLSPPGKNDYFDNFMNISKYYQQNGIDLILKDVLLK